MAYKVIRFFDDLQDNGYHYNTGDYYPRVGLDVSQQRINELMGNNNKQLRPLIVKVTGKPVQEPVEEGAVDLATAKFFTLKSLAKKHGIEAEGKDAATLREELAKVM